MKLFALTCCLALLSLPAVLVGEEPIRADGLVLPYRDIKLSATFEAKLYKVSAAEGQKVSQGDVLAILYSELERLDRDRAEKIVARTKFESEANEKLAREKIVSPDKALESKMQFQLASIDLARTEALLEEKTIRAPWNGQIVRRFAEEGETISRAKEIFQLVDYSQVFVTFYLEARYLPRITEGAPAKVTIPALGFSDLDAVVHFVDPVVDAGSGLFRVKLLIANDKLLIKPGLQAICTIRP